MNTEQQRQAANQQKMNQELDQFLTNTIFPDSMIEPGFPNALYRALEHESASSLSCNWTMLKSIRAKAYAVSKCVGFTMAQMAYALNAIEGKTPVQLKCGGLEVAEYDPIMDMQERMSIRWNEIIAPEKERIAKKYSNQKPLFVPHNKKLITN